MEIFAFIFWTLNQPSAPARQVTTQSEDACVLLARTVTAGLAVDGMCVNEMTGVVLFFRSGKQVDKL